MSDERCGGAEWFEENGVDAFGAVTTIREGRCGGCPDCVGPWFCEDCGMAREEARHEGGSLCAACFLGPHLEVFAAALNVPSVRGEA